MNEPEPQKDITPIVKLKGDTPTEILLAQLCDKVFLDLWAYPNPYANHDGKPTKEICDVLAVFENHVFIFSDKKSELDPEKINDKTWDKWKRVAIDKSIKQVKGAERWIRNNPEKIFIDKKCTKKLPIPIDKENLKIHRIIVAHGADVACKNDSPNNINGSLAICYADLKNSTKPSESPRPFDLILPRDDIIHVFDSHNLEIILGELDTVCDLLSYFEAKEEAIRKYKVLRHCGEEELLFMYLNNFDKKRKKHYIGVKDKNIDFIDMGDGYWDDFIKSDRYKIKKHADKVSYLWDDLLKKTLKNALKGTLTGNANVFRGESALNEMAKEPRVIRRLLSNFILDSFKKFPDDKDIMGPYNAYFSISSSDCMYVFLQLTPLETADYDKEYRIVRGKMLEVACGVVKNKFPHLKKVIGIAMEPPKHNSKITEDFILLDCKNWTEEDAKFFKEYSEKENKETGLNFLQKKDLKIKKGTFHEFPPAPNYGDKKQTKTKPHRNDPCPCGSGKKYKRCCYLKGFNTLTR